MRILSLLYYEQKAQYRRFSPSRGPMRRRKERSASINPGFPLFFQSDFFTTPGFHFEHTLVHFEYWGVQKDRTRLQKKPCTILINVIQMSLSTLYATYKTIYNVLPGIVYDVSPKVIKMIFRTSVPPFAFRSVFPPSWLPENKDKKHAF